MDEAQSAEDVVHENVPVVASVHATEVRASQGSFDYPLISDWMKFCERHMERGRDKHEYSLLAPMFEANGCTRIDDIPRMTTTMILELAGVAGVGVTIGLVNRVHEYATEDVMRVKAGRTVV